MYPNASCVSVSMGASLSMSQSQSVSLRHGKKERLTNVTKLSCRARFRKGRILISLSLSPSLPGLSLSLLMNG